MTSEPDSKPGRRPPTIELKATEVEQPAAAGQPDATAPPGGSGAADAPPPQSSGPASEGAQPTASSPSRLKSHALGAVLGAVAMAVIAAALWFAGVVPPREAAAPSAPAAPETSAAVQSVQNDDAAIAARLDKLERAAAAQRTQPSQGNQAAAAEAQTKALSDSIEALTQRVDAIAAASQSAAKTADAAQAAAEAAKTASEKTGQSVSRAAGQAASQAASQVASQTGVQKSDLDALASRIASLEGAVKALSENAAHPAEGANDQAARSAVAAEALRATVLRGAPYRAELAAVQSLGVAHDATMPLEPFAANGVPTAAALAHELAALTPDLRRAAAMSSGGSTILERLEAHARHLVHITPVNAPPGNEPSAVIARIELDAAHADIAAAQSDIAALPDAAKSRAADWLDRARARDAAIAASRKIAAGALADLSKPVSQ